MSEELQRQLERLAERVAELEAKDVSPYLLAHEAAAYLKLPSVRALKALVERGLLKPLPGHKIYRFRRADLDKYLCSGRRH